MYREIGVAISNRRMVALRRQAVAWMHGFYAESYPLYDFSTHGFRPYVSDYQYAVRLAKLNKSPYLLDDKLVFYMLMTALGMPTPKVYAFSHRGSMTLLDDETASKGLRHLLDHKGRLVVKPRGGSGGAGFRRLDRSGDTIEANGRKLRDIEEVLTTGSQIVTEFVEQHEYARRIYAGSTNTLRLLTLPDGSGQPFIAGAIHRFGTDYSQPVDNVDAGGINCFVDVSTGVVGSGAAEPLHTAEGGGAPVWYDVHPDTGVAMAGTVLPHWSTVMAGVLTAAAALPEMPYLGWDVVITSTGYSIIEANSRSAVSLFQLHRPLLLDERVATFFRAVSNS